MCRMSNYPIYIPSKGRWKSRLTVKSLNEMNVDYFVIVEDQEFKDYASVIDKKKLLVLDRKYQREYDTFDNFGLEKSPGPGPARNFAWDHSLSNGHKWHWVMDDNINGFYRMNKNIKIKNTSASFWLAMEDFVLRYENVAMAGPNYFMFGKRKEQMTPFRCNTRIYSFNFIRNDTPYRWRGRYNEDTDLSLRMLKDGWCTIQFNAFLQMKTTTQQIGGGNTKEFYAKEGTLPKSRMQVMMHPDVSRIAWRFGRWHHFVDYRPFKNNKLKKRQDLKLKEGNNEFGMKLIYLK